MGNRFRGSLLILILLTGPGLLADPVASPDARREASAPVVAQKTIGDMACGPCALYNALANGPPELRAIVAKLPGNTPEERVKLLIKSYGGKPSPTYNGKRNRYTDKYGLAPEDCAGFINDCLSAHTTLKVTGTYLDRHKGEPQGQHFRRVHRWLRQSLDAGFPPIVDLRSFVARPEGRDYKWQGLMGHFVVIVELPPKLAEDDKSFTFRFADSATGTIETGHAHLEEARNFTATRKFSVAKNGSEHWEWITDYPYLLATAPALRLLTQKQPWHARTTIVLRHAVFVAAPAAKAIQLKAKS